VTIKTVIYKHIRKTLNYDDEMKRVFSVKKICKCE